MNDLEKISGIFYELCAKYQALTKEYNKNNPDNKRNEYFKYQFPNSYDNLMYVFTLVPSFDKLPELSKWLEVKDKSTGCELVRKLVEEGVNTIYTNTEYQNLYNQFINQLNQLYNSIPYKLNYTLEYYYLYTKILAESNIKQNIKKEILNHLLYLISKSSYVKFDQISSEEELNDYNQLPDYDENETDKFYQMVYNWQLCNIGGCDLNNFFCPLHKLQYNSKSINLQKIINENNTQISRTLNKKFLDKNKYVNPTYYHYYNYNNKKIKQYITGDIMKKSDIENAAENIIRKYSKNNTFDINLMSKTLCDKIFNIYTNLPSTCSLDYWYNSNVYGLNKINNPDILIILNKEIDERYFDGYITFFANWCSSSGKSTESKIKMNDPVCTEYLFTIQLLNILTFQGNSELKRNVTRTAYYLMLNYINDKFNKFYSSIKQKIGIDDFGNYDESKDIIRTKAISEGYGEKYDKYMKINYLRLFKLDLLQEYEEYYNIFKTISSYLEKQLALLNFDKSTSINYTRETELIQINVEQLLKDIRDSKQSYSNNDFLKNFGFKYYFNEILKNINTEEYSTIYNDLITILEKIAPSRLMEYYTNEGIDSIFNDYTYYYILKQNHCPECYKYFLDFISNGFYDIFKEINIYKQYQNLNSSIEKPDIEINESAKITNMKEIFEDDGNKKKLKVDLCSFGFKGEYYYTIDEYTTTQIKLTSDSDIVKHEQTYERKKIGNATQGENIISEGIYNVELMFNNLIKRGSVFQDAKIIDKMNFYKTSTVENNNFKKSKSFININDNNMILYTTADNEKIKSFEPRYTIYNSKTNLYINNNIIKIMEKTDVQQNNGIIYVNSFTENEYPAIYQINKNNNYLYDIKNKENLETLILKGGNTNNYVMVYNDVSNLYDAMSNINIKPTEKVRVAINRGDGDAVIVQLYDNASGLLLDNIAEYKYRDSDTEKYFSDIPVYYIENSTLEESDNEFSTVNVTSNINGYILSGLVEGNKIDLIIISNITNFKNNLTSLRRIYSLKFNYEYDSDKNKYKLVSTPYVEDKILLLSSLIINKSTISYRDGDNKIKISGQPMDTDLEIYAWGYMLNNVKVTVSQNSIYTDVTIPSDTNVYLQKEFFVKDFNKLMLRKCFPDNFKRTLICNQDVLNAVDGNKYSIPDVKIKEALYEYGKYPKYLEHYFMFGCVDYKLKGKFNVRCLANLGSIPETTKYLDNNLGYKLYEVMIQGENMIIQNGKIQSEGDIYLVGIESSNNHMFCIPPTKIVNRGLLKVIDFQQFDNLFDRVELILDDNIKDYIIKELSLSNIGTLKNMKYINFY